MTSETVHHIPVVFCDHVLKRLGWIVRTRRGGRLVIEFYSDEELDRLYSIIVLGAAATSDGSGRMPLPIVEGDGS